MFLYKNCNKLIILLNIKLLFNLSLFVFYKILILSIILLNILFYKGVSFAQESNLLYRQNELKQNSINIIPSCLVKPSREGSSAILVEKSSQTLWVYTSRNGEFTNALKLSCSTGEVDGPKMVEGDKKTPEGIYFIKQIYEDRFLTPIYGSRAFVTDYPNLLDRISGKTGSAIWLHGTNKELKPMDSNGCVAMNNNDVIKLDSYIVIDETPIIIVDKFDYVPIETNIEQRIDIINFISKWIEALNSGSYLDYLFYYGSNYIPDAQWWTEWLDIRSKTAILNPIKAQVDYIGIYRHKNHFVVLLDFQAASRYRMISIGKRKLFINSYINSKSSYNRSSYKIIGDTFQIAVVKKTNNNSFFINTVKQLYEEDNINYEIK